jgi:hypothetical protein
MEPIVALRVLLFEIPFFLHIVYYHYQIPVIGLDATGVAALMQIHVPTSLDLSSRIAIRSLPGA